MAKQRVQVMIDKKLYGELNQLRDLEDRSESKMTEILIREAIATRRLAAAKVNANN